MKDIDYQIEGSDLQTLKINLMPGQKLCAETGSMVYMQNSITMHTNTAGGLFSSMKRMLGGGDLFLTQFENTSSSDNAQVAFAAPYPGKVVAVDLADHGGELLAHKDSFLCASADTKVDIAFTKRFSSGFFGGDGFILQRLRGNNLSFIHTGGSCIQHTLKAGETLKVDVGCLSAFESSVSYEIALVKGVSNILFGAEGLFFVKLTGPGKVYLQSMPLARLSHRIGTMLPKK